MDFFRSIFYTPFTQLEIEQQALVVFVILACLTLAGYSVISIRRRTAKARGEFTRSRVRHPIKVSWKDTAGQQQHEEGRCRNISEDGLRFELQSPIALHAEVSFSVPEAKIEGTAEVRHCSQSDLRYLIGVKFRVVSR